VVLTLCLGLPALAGTGPPTGLRWRWPVTAGALCMLGLSLLVHRLVERRLGRRLRQRLTLDMRPRNLSARPALTRTP
jgi:peptidoglycan/LPS O-acetylase OafA/YrhL